jgi:hypothetical protein
MVPGATITPSSSAEGKRLKRYVTYMIVQVLDHVNVQVSGCPCSCPSSCSGSCVNYAILFFKLSGHGHGHRHSSIKQTLNNGFLDTDSICKLKNNLLLINR